MNPIDDFAALRPDVESPTPDELDELWARVITLDGAGAVSHATAPHRRRRRIAMVGAAASLIVGVAAIVLVADRADAPAGDADTQPGATIITAPEATSPTTVAEVVPVDTVDAPPTWVVPDEAWIAWAPEVSFDPGMAAVTLVAGPRGIVESWVAIVDGVSDPLMSGGGLATDTASEADAPIIAWRTDPGDGNAIVSAGGVARPDAREVFAAVSAGDELPSGFTALPAEAGALAQQRVTQRFDHPDGRWIEVEIQSGGQPRFDAEMQRATAAEFFTPPAGTDVSNIAFVDGYTLVVRSGFWVSTIRTSASSGAATDFTDLIGLVELGDPDASSGVVPIARLAIGDSVMLGAAEQLIADGLTVDAVESRGFADGLDLVRTLAERDRLPETMVVHLGSNGLIDEPSMSAFIALVADVDRVILVTSAIGRDYAEPNNELIAASAAANDNIDLLDWAGLAASCPGDCFATDGLHLTPGGRAYYAALIAAVLVGEGA